MLACGRESEAAALRAVGREAEEVKSSLEEVALSWYSSSDWVNEGFAHPWDNQPQSKIK